MLTTLVRLIQDFLEEKIGRLNGPEPTLLESFLTVVRGAALCVWCVTVPSQLERNVVLNISERALVNGLYNNYTELQEDDIDHRPDIGEQSACWGLAASE